MREGGVKIPDKLPTLFMDGPLPAVQIWQDELISSNSIFFKLIFQKLNADQQAQGKGLATFAMIF